MTYISKRATKEQWYNEVKEADSVKIYGPYRDERSAAHAAFLSGSFDDLKAAIKEHKNPAHYTPVKTSRFDENELKSLKEDPEAYGMRNFELLPPTELKEHLSWANKDKDNLFEHYVGWRYTKASISKRAKEERFEDWGLSNPLTSADLKRIYELEYKLSQLQQRDLTMPSSLRRIQDWEGELRDLIRKANRTMREIYKYWIDLHNVDEVDFYDTAKLDFPGNPKLFDRAWDMFLVGERTRYSDYFQSKQLEAKKQMLTTEPFASVIRLYKRLSKDSDDMTLFQEALNTAHYGGLMIDHLKDKTNITKGLLDDLSAGKFIKEWDEQIHKMAETKTQPISFEDIESLQKSQEQEVEALRQEVKQEQQEKRKKMWELGEKSDSIKLDLPKEHYRELAEKNPSGFLGYSELINSYPEYVGLAMESLIQRDPQIYFISKYYNRPGLEHLNEPALLRLLSTRPEVYFNIGLHKDSRFERYKEPAAFAVAQFNPKYFMDVVLPIMPEFKHLKQIAEEKLRHKMAFIRYAMVPGNLKRIYELEYKLFKLKQSGYVGHRVDYMKRELDHLLGCAIKDLRKGFGTWIERYTQYFRDNVKDIIQSHEESTQYKDIPEEILFDLVRQKHFDTPEYKRITAIYNELAKGVVNAGLFQKALTTAHHTGKMIDFIPGLEGNQELLDALTAGEFNDGWDKELGIIAEYGFGLRKLAKKRRPGESVGVFAVLPEKLAKQFPSLGEHDSSPTHITVLYIGGVPKKHFDLLINTVKGVLYDQEPFEVEMEDKVSYFPATKHSDGCKIAKMGIKSKELHALHRKLKDALKTAKVDIDDHFPTYKPHTTLQYMPKGQEQYEGKTPSGSWTIKEVEIWGCGKKERLKLKAKTINKEASVYGYWLSPENKLYEVGYEKHKDFMIKHPEFFGRLSDYPSYEGAFKLGWIRITMCSDAISFEAPDNSDKYVKLAQNSLSMLPPKKNIWYELWRRTPDLKYGANLPTSVFLAARDFAELTRMSRKQERIENVASIDKPAISKRASNIKIELDDQERKIFDLLKKTKEYYNLPVQLRVVGGWTRDAVLKQIKRGIA